MVTTRRRMFGNMRFSPTPAVFVILAVLVVMFLATGIHANVAKSTWLTDLLLLDANAVLRGEVWRLASYGLLHSLMSPFHLILNGLMFFMFGREIEERFGTLKFVFFILAAVIVGGIFVVAGALMGIGAPLALGFSAAVEAIIVCWALYNRNTPVRFFFMIPMRGIHMLWLGLAMWVLDAVSLSAVSASAHLGGIATGFAAYFLTARRNRVRLFWDNLLAKLRIRKQPKLTVVPPKDRWVN